MTGFATQKTPLRLAIFVVCFLIFLLLLSMIRGDWGSNSPQMSADVLPQKVFGADHYTLENGLEIVVVPNHRAPVVTHMVWYKVGAADETIGQSGIAHFLEHLMFKGSTGLAAGEFSEIIRGLGGHDNAFTSQDYTAYFQSIAKEHLATVMKMEAGRMRGMNPPAGAVLSERNVILEERAQRTDNKPSALFNEQMRALAFINHPYGVPVIGWRHEIEQMEWPTIKAFYDRFYGPNNAILVVTGDVTGEEVRSLASKIYGSLPMIEIEDRTRTTTPALIATPELKLREDSIHQPMFNLHFRAPSTAQDQDTSLALQVLQEIMGASSASRLYKSLVIEQKIASHINFSYDSASLNDSSLWITAYPSEGIEPEAVDAAIQVELQKVITDGVTEDELIAAKQRMQDSTFFALDSLSGPAMIIGRELTTGSSLDYIENWPHLVNAVTAAQVQEAASEYLNPADKSSSTSLVRGTLLPAVQVEEEGVSQ